MNPHKPIARAATRFIGAAVPGVGLPPATGRIQRLGFFCQNHVFEFSNGKTMIEKSMREPCYPFAETTEILGIPETKLRQWQAAIPIFFMGEKARGRIWFTGLEVFVLAIMRDLVATGYTPHAAMITAFRTAGGPMLRKPRDGEFALVGSEGDAEFIDRRGEFAELGGVRRTGILIPLRAIWDEISAKCEARYES